MKGKVLKVNPFGLFVELDPEIHGLAHVSELSDKPVQDTTQIAKEGEIKEFRVISIDPQEHRLGLSLKSEEKKPKAKKSDKEAVTEGNPPTGGEEKTEEVKEDSKE